MPRAALLSHPPEIDRYDRAGGLLIYGIPGFKLEKEVVLRRWKQYEESSIRFNLNCSIGKDISLKELRSKHSALLIATGVYKARDRVRRLLEEEGAAGL